MLVKSTVIGLTIAAAVLSTAGSLSSYAQQPAKVPRIVFVAQGAPGPNSAAFEEGLRELGYVAGRNVMVETRFADGHTERLPAFVAEAIRLKADVLVVNTVTAALVAKRATATLPIVVIGVIDPVGQGLVASLARPGGNITGTSLGIGEAFAGKWLELLKEMVPTVSHAAALWNPSNPGAAIFAKQLEMAAQSVNVKLDAVAAKNITELEGAFAAIGTSGARAVIVTADPVFLINRVRIVQFAAAKRLPAVYFFKDFVDAGGLMSYGPSLHESHRRAAAYVDKILKGANPADLPVEQPTSFELVLNLKAAKTLGLTIPQPLLLRADRVIN